MKKLLLIVLIAVVSFLSGCSKYSGDNIYYPVTSNGIQIVATDSIFKNKDLIRVDRNPFDDYYPKWEFIKKRNNKLYFYTVNRTRDPFTEYGCQMELIQSYSCDTIIDGSYCLFYGYYNLKYPEKYTLCDGVIICEYYDYNKGTTETVYFITKKYAKTHNYTITSYYINKNNKIDYKVEATTK